MTQVVTGNVTGGTTAYTPALAFGNVHVGDAPTLNYQVGNGRLRRTRFCGARNFRTSANGGNITDSRLSGHGCHRWKLRSSPLLGANTGNLAITFTASSAGALTSQDLFIINNFDNVADQTLTITGTAYRYANPTAHTPEPINFGNFHVGDTAPSHALSLTNNVPADSFSEALDASIGSPTGGVTANGGSFSLLAPTATNSTSLVVGLDTSSSQTANKSGTATITLKSDGSGSSNLGLTTLTSQIVNITGSVYRLAAPSAHTPDPINFGIVHVNDTAPSQPLTIGNTAATDGFSEKLNATIGGVTGGVTTNGGSITRLAPGATDSTSLSVGIGTLTAGSKNGTAIISLTSDGTGTSGLGLTPLTAQTVHVTGQVNYYADPLFNFSIRDRVFDRGRPHAFHARFRRALPEQWHRLDWPRRGKLSL